MTSTTTIHRHDVRVPLLGHSDRARTAIALSVLDNGWALVTYRKADGTRVERIATRNPTIIGALGTASDKQAVRVSAEGTFGIVYWDQFAGGIRSFRVEGLESIFILAYSPEDNH